MISANLFLLPHCCTLKKDDEIFNKLEMKKLLNNKFNLGFFPTPMHQLKNLSNKYSDYSIYIKRDDQTGLASGGNKTRKLEYLIKEAIDTNCNVVFTAGAQQSNHCRQTAAACALAGIECHIIVKGNEPKRYQGNLLLSHLLGAKIHFTTNYTKEIDFNSYISKLEKDKKAFIIPIGGSNITGTLGYIEAIKELKLQLEEQHIKIDYLFFASSSGGTQAGIMLGMQLYDLDFELIPIKIDKDTNEKGELAEVVLNLVNEGESLLNLKTESSLSDIPLNRSYNDAEYGVLTKNETSAIHELALQEGILLDPVYTGRAFYGMLDCLKNKKLKPNSNILFWHTGGLPALFEYANGLKEVQKR